MDEKELENVQKSNLMTEGAARIIIGEKAETFYNPIQEYNRDLT
jgi:tRNA G26 N,N-dimethylase Trm1